MKLIWYGSVDSGKLTLTDPDGFRRALHSFVGPVEVIIEPEKRYRSVQQNRYLWGVVYRLIADHTGHSAEEIHEMMKFRFNQRRLEVGGDILDYGGSTTELTTAEFEVYAEAIRRWAAEKLSLNIPEPGQAAFL